MQVQSWTPCCLSYLDWHIHRKSWKIVKAQWQAVICFKFLVKYVMLCFVWAVWGLLFWKPVAIGLLCFEMLSVLFIIILTRANLGIILSEHALSCWFNCYTISGNFIVCSKYCFPLIHYAKVVTASIQKPFGPCWTRNMNLEDLWLTKLYPNLLLTNLRALLTLHTSSLTFEGVLASCMCSHLNHACGSVSFFSHH